MLFLSFSLKPWKYFLFSIPLTHIYHCDLENQIFFSLVFLQTTLVLLNLPSMYIPWTGGIPRSHISDLHMNPQIYMTATNLNKCIDDWQATWTWLFGRISSGSYIVIVVPEFWSVWPLYWNSWLYAHALESPPYEKLMVVWWVGRKGKTDMVESRGNNGKTDMRD